MYSIFDKYLCNRDTYLYNTELRNYKQLNFTT